ncbi:N-acetylneuraminate 9-O-acetyltransferase-like isoform X2 [Pomacea canaliculata]|uniref:N-acetylneuraminate 9-O-acetyltransferase-like isoform X2 n=1 Tax=Pomacea canaliculata TaxID=400727 RepID=UPI000D7255A9|nr:N-acetylneuraminate 9-O-acetyltransferase-like isoform X2 [Pomacea canaliculata]
MEDNDAATASSSNSSSEITQYINIENAKLVALVIVLGFVGYHGVLHLKYGNDSCRWLLSDGRFPGYNTWQPYGCMMHKYTRSDARMCMHYISYWGGRNHITFVGDSRIRNLYYEFINLISLSELEEAKAQSDIHFSDEKINARVDFLWQPYVNAHMYDVYDKWLKSEQPGSRPNLVITGSASWSIKTFNGSTQALENFKANLSMIRPLFQKLKPSTNIIWMLQDPVVEAKLSIERAAITNLQIDDYNKAAIELLENSEATIWSSSRLIAQGLKKESVDGLHPSHSTLSLDVQILLNLYCNNDMNHHDGTCCNTPEPATTLQIITAAAFLVCMASAVGLVAYRRRLRRIAVKARAENGQRNGGNGAPKALSETAVSLVTSVAKLGLIMSYFYLCDRTNFFMKENKYYTHVNFFLPFAYVMILGFFFTENTEKTNVMHRDQTDEWKGWMQLVILIYHLTGASKVLPIYMHIRLLVSSYLFLTGFGHFTYFWQHGNFGLIRHCMHGCRHCQIFWHARKNSLRRALEVLVRLNLLVVVLCFVMNRPYQFYYFVPLVSFWYLVVYIVMAVWPHITHDSSEANSLHYLYMVIKFVILIVLISLFYLSEVFFEKVFLARPFKALFVTSDDSIHEWRFRWELDRYSVVYGMLVGFGYQVLVHYKILQDNHNQSLFGHPFSWIFCLLGLVGIASYMVFSLLCSSKQQCNYVHPYLVFIPIISYILLRNVPGWLRTRYSSLFAWFGKISLELFICQYHIWLAADTHGVLVLLPSYPVLNVVITSFIFICIAHEISVITGILARYIVPDDWKAVLRNFIVFAAVLLPLCITNGVLVF